jgi:hypothetical protein
MILQVCGQSDYFAAVLAYKLIPMKLVHGAIPGYLGRWLDPQMTESAC